VIAGRNGPNKQVDFKHPKTRAGTANSGTSTSPASSRQHSRNDVRSDHPSDVVMPRTSSIDSAISSISNASGPNKALDQKEPSIADIRNLIATAGSAENLVQHLLRDKAHAAAQNAQLWKLVDKQRTLLLGLNKDLDRVSKERDRFRKKAKDLATAQSNQPLDRHVSGSHSPPRTPPTDDLPIQMTEAESTQDVALRSVAEPSRAEQSSPIDPGMMPQPLHPHLQQQQQQAGSAPPASSKPSSIRTDLSAPTFAVTAATPVTASPKQSFSTKRQVAPKPLDLRSSREDSTLPQVAPMESDKADGEKRSAEDNHRGRRLTREDDDKDRETAALQQMQEETRSRSKKDKKSQIHATDASTKLMPAASIDAQPQPTSSKSNHHVTPSDASAYSQRSTEGVMLSPPMRSPGLPSSPRPAVAMVSPEAHMALNALPLSPRHGAFPLSPRAPKQPIPMPSNVQQPPPQGQLQAQTQHQPQPQPQPSMQAPETELPPRSASLRAPAHDQTMSSPSDIPPVWRGLMVPHLPDLLLPPNALPSIQIKVASSRLRPSRFSMLGLKPQEDTSVFSLSIYSRSSPRELWRIEKIPAALPHLDQQIRPRCPELPKIPDRKLFNGHSPVTLDARRNAIDMYFEELLDTHIDEASAMIICKFLSTDVLEPAQEAPQGKVNSPPMKGVQPSNKKTGYLTKKGKNFGGWKSRFFVLDSPELRYYESPGGAHLGTIKLLNAKIGRQTNNETNSAEDAESETQYRHAFLILEPKRKDSNSYVRHVLCAENDMERDEWVTVLLTYIEEGSDPSRPLTSSGPSSTGTANHPRTLLRGTDYGDAQSEASAKNASPMIGSATSGSASPTSSVTPPLEQGAVDAHARAANAHLGIPGNPRGGNRQSTAVQNNQKIRNLFQFRKSSHEALNGPLNEHRPPHSARRDYVRPVFGLSLAEAVEVCPPVGIDVELPAVVYRSIEYLRGKKAANEEGLFRLSGSNIVIRTLKERFNAEGDVDLLGEEEYYDVHAVASLFKTYLRELPSTLLTRDLHVEFLKVLELPDKQEKIVAFHHLVHRLPRVNFVLLRTLSEYLLEVVSNQDRNKMTVKNVGIVFSPTLNIPAPVFSMFLTEFEAIFGNSREMNGRGPQTATSDHYSQSDSSSPRRQMFNESTISQNQHSFAQNSTTHARHPYTGEQTLADNGMTPLQSSYESRSYVSIPDANRAPPQPMYPPPAQPDQSNPAGYRVIAPEGSVSAKQKRRESAMLLF
jgi:RalA-binding protein 1